MATARTPLLADTRRLSEQSDRRADEEDAALQSQAVGNDSSAETPSGRPGLSWVARAREVLLFVWALLATAAVIVLAVVLQHRNSAIHNDADSLSLLSAPSLSSSESTSALLGSKTPGKRNLIFMVSDGMGPASLSLTRSFRQLVEDLPIDDVLTLDQHFWGTSRTRSSSSLITDSAAGATAFGCAEKSYNGAIAVTPDHKPCGTVLEAAKRAGHHTGLVVTTDVTDATPACFASHVRMRTQMDEIALQEIGEGPLGRSVDLIMGGGRCHFRPNSSSGSCRQDDVDVVDIATRKHGWTYAGDRAGFDALQLGENVTLPALGLFAYYNVPFEIDRKNMADVYPSLSEMVITALRALEKSTEDSDRGFFLMIEGSRIDHAGHINDPAAQVREVLEYDKAFKDVLNFLDKSETEGVLVATSDHETGGLSTAWHSPDEEPVYKWYPEVLAAATASSEYLGHLLRAHIAANPELDEDALKEWIHTELVSARLGINDAQDVELSALAARPADASRLFSRMVSQRARVGWSSHGHSAVDVNIYSSGGPEAERIRGNVENIDVGRFLREYLGVDVEPITNELKKKMKIAEDSEVEALKGDGAGEMDELMDEPELAHTGAVRETTTD